MPRVLVSQLPMEIIESEVLPRTPAKAVCRFKLVCKGWNSLISTAEFSRMHLRYQTNYKLLLLGKQNRVSFRTHDCGLQDDSVTCTQSSHVVPFKFKDDVHVPSLILGSLDGLVCVTISNAKELAFWNPLTGAYKKFSAIFHNQMIQIYNGAFAFYKDSSNDYKFLHIVPDGAFIYSRRLDSWRKVPCLESHRVSSSCHWLMATLLGDKVYFKVKNWRHEGDHPWYVVSFDVESEKFTEIQIPSFPVGCSASCYLMNLNASLVVLNGCLHLFLAYGNASHQIFTYGKVCERMKCDVWSMDGHGDGWIKVRAISSSPHFSTPYTFIRRLHVRKSGNWLAIWEDINNNNSIKSIDIEDFITDFFSLSSSLRPHERVGAIYVETLISPNP